MIKSFVTGLLLGSAVAFALGMNVGREAPLLSNPFAKRDIGHSVQEKAGSLVDSARTKIHDATRPRSN